MTYIPFLAHEALMLMPMPFAGYVYAGQGGNDLLGNKAQIADQTLKLGNLALVRPSGPASHCCWMVMVHTAVLSAFTSQRPALNLGY